MDCPSRGSASGSRRGVLCTLDERDPQDLLEEPDSSVPEGDYDQSARLYFLIRRLAPFPDNATHPFDHGDRGDTGSSIVRPPWRFGKYGWVFPREVRHFARRASGEDSRRTIGLAVCANT